jgi:hypothetical protein
LPSQGTTALHGFQGFWEGRANCGGTLAIFFLQIHALISTLTHSRGFFTMEREDIAPYQDEDTRLQRVWLQSNASANTGEGMGSEPGSGSPAARRARPDPFEFDQEFFAIGHSGGSQTRENRGTRGSRGNSGHRGRIGRGPSSGSSTGIHAATRGENVPPRSPTRRTSRPHSPARDVPQGSEHDERQGLKCAVDSEGMEEGSTALGSQSKKRKNRGKRDKRSDEIRNHCRALLLEWFRNNNMVFLEKQCLNDGTKGLELVKNDLMLLLMVGTARAEFEESRGMSD